jgi:fermentation-respiration switch protein FrsA (DUF1100 family)
MQKIIVLVLICFISSTSYAIRPNNHYDRTPANLGIAYDSLNLNAVDHYRLTAWLCHPSKQKALKTIVLVPQDAGNMADNLDIVKAMLDVLPVDILLFDYRGFGTSDVMVIDSDLVALPEFVRDLDAAVDAVVKNHDRKNILLYGRSMGASISIAFARGQNFGGVIAESPYVTQLALKKYYSKEYKESGSTRKIKLIGSNALEPLASAKMVESPLLIIHGQLERQISSDEICSLYRAIGSKRKTLWIVENADHMQVPFVQTGAFLSQVYSMLTAP